MGVWDVATPAGSDLLSQGDDRIRELKTALLEMFRGGAADGVEAIAPGSAPTTAPIFRYRGLKGTTAARPAFGQYGLYFNETLNSIQRDSGSAWVDVGTHIPAGTKMVFYQASAPTGWTAVAVNDKFLRVVTAGGTGGTTGGSGLTPSSTVTLAHTHTVASHTHDLGNHTHSTPAHTHTLAATGGGSVAIDSASRSVGGIGSEDGNLLSGTTGAAATIFPVKGITNSEGSGTSGAPSSNTSGGATPATDSQLANTAFQYADLIIATKD